MRLASFNVLHGRSLADGVVSTERLVEACVSLNADVLCLQEIDRGQPRSGGVDQVAAVAEGMGAQWWRFEPALIGIPGGTWRAATDGDWQGDASTAEPAYGVGIVSRLEVASWHAVRLAPAPVRAPVVVPGGRGRFIWLRDEPRVGLAAALASAGASAAGASSAGAISALAGAALAGAGRGPSRPDRSLPDRSLPDGSLMVATTHLSFVPGYNALQLRRLTRALAGLGGAPGGATVLLGDMNLPGRLPAAASGWRPLARVRTYPAQRPSLQVDHALGHGPVPPVERVEARLLLLSDHRALVVDLR